MAEQVSGMRRSAAGRVLHGVDLALSKFEAIVLAYGVILMFVNTVANVIGRIAGQSLYFSEEINQFLIVLITFVGLGYAARRGRHIRMSAVYDQLGDRGKKVLMIVIAAFTAAVMFVLAWYSYEYVERLSRRGRVTPALQIPVYLTYLWVPIGFVITGLQYVFTVVKNLVEEEVYISYEEVDAYDETDHGGHGSGAGV
jgi:TRAP-type C4-dicarboxylate transport system permease small subunit